MNCASRGDMPKNAGLKWSKSGRNAPDLVYILPGTLGSGSYKAATSHRSCGTSLTASPPRIRNSQNSPGLAPPGKRQAMPMTAIGSFRNFAFIESRPPGHRKLAVGRGEQPKKIFDHRGDRRMI